MDSGGGTFRRRAFASVVEATFDESRLAGWSAGPAPFENARSRAGEDQRATYFDQRIRRALYSADGESQRWHRFEGPGVGPWGGLGIEIEAVEVCRLRFAGPGARSLLVLHGTLPADRPIEALHDISRIESGEDARQRYSLPGDGLATVEGGTKRATTAAFLTPAGELPPAFPGDYGDWSRHRQWLWLLASATPFDRYPPDPSLRGELSSSTLRISRDWDALVLRDGIGYLGRREDRGVDDPFFADAELYFRSIYLDALLLGIAQKATLGSIADEVAELDDPRGMPTELRGLERRVARFRNVYWWTHLSAHGPANELTQLYSRQHRLNSLASQVFEEIGEHARQVQTDAAERTNGLLSLLTVVGVPLGVIVAVLQVLEVNSPAKVALIVSVSTVLLGAVFWLAIPDPAAAFRRGPRRDTR